MTKGRRIGSSEVAKLAGVSRSTVSKVVNNYGDVSEKTKKRVRQVIKDCGYTPNIAARILAGKKAYTLGLFFILNQDREYDFAEDTIVDRMLATVAATAAEKGFLTLTIIIKTLDEESRDKIRDIFTQGRIDGGIFIGVFEEEPLIEELVDKNYPLGLLDYKAPDQGRCNRMILNFDPRTAHKAVEYLIKLGHTKILAFHGDLRRHDGKTKYKEFMESMKNHGIPVIEEWNLFSGFSSTTSYRMMKEFLKDREKNPTAVFCANDHIAHGILRALAEEGKQVPRDISVIGIDDALFSRYMNPPLTTFAVDFSEMLKRLTQKVTEYIKTPFDIPFQETQKARLITRESCRNILERS